jgi:hypothetical protein
MWIKPESGLRRRSAADTQGIGAKRISGRVCRGHTRRATTWSGRMNRLTGFPGDFGRGRLISSVKLPNAHSTSGLWGTAPRS